MAEGAHNITDFPTQQESASTPITPLEHEMIDLFVHFAQLFSLPKSLGEIFGLLFASENELTFDEIVAKLQISKGSASQGLRFLRSIGAVHTVYIPGNRKDHYVAEDRVRPLLTGFLRERLQPHLSSGEQRLGRIQDLAQDPETTNQIGTKVKMRVERLRKWNLKLDSILPLILRIIAPK